MKSFLKKAGLLASAVITTGCQSENLAVRSLDPSEFAPDETGVVSKTYMLQSCDGAEKFYSVEIDTDGKLNRPEYVGTTDAFKTKELQKSIKNYKFGVKPTKTQGHTEIDLIQNNFVDLVDALEEEKEKQNRIIASISHDIKTPLTAIMGYSDRLLNSSLDNEKKKSYIEKIHNKSLTLRDLTEEFDDYLSCNIVETLK